MKYSHFLVSSHPSPANYNYMKNSHNYLDKSPSTVDEEAVVQDIPQSFVMKLNMSDRFSEAGFRLGHEVDRQAEKEQGPGKRKKDKWIKCITYCFLKKIN